MKILLVEDKEIKRDRVKSCLLSGEIGIDVVVDTANDYDSAIKALEEGYYDLVVLDLLIPGPSLTLNADYSKAIIHRVLKNDGVIQPSQFIGLTEHDHIAENQKEFYDENLFALLKYTSDGDEWCSRLLSKIRYLKSAKLAAANFMMNSYDLDVVVLAARHENEFVPLKKALFGSSRTASHPLFPDSALGSIDGPGGRKLKTALICVSEMGMAATAAVATQAITVLRPRLISMLGMCCGFSSQNCCTPQKIMDAVIVREVSCWEEGKYEEDGDASEFKNRYKSRLVSDAIRNQIENIVEKSEELISPELKKFIKSRRYIDAAASFESTDVGSIPSVRFAALVSGSSVIADGAKVAEIIKRKPNAVGLDMEIYGLYTAVERSNGKRPAVFSVKGVADFGMKAKNDKAQAVATEVSAIVFKSVLKNLSFLA